MYDTELKQYIGDSLDDILEGMMNVRAEEKEEEEKEATKKPKKINLKEENSYQAHFQSMLKKWNIKSPSELNKEKKKEFFNQLSSTWKKKKGREE